MTRCAIEANNLGGVSGQAGLTDASMGQARRGLLLPQPVDLSGLGQSFSERGELKLIARARVAPFNGAGSQLDDGERPPCRGNPAGFDVAAYL